MRKSLYTAAMWALFGCSLLAQAAYTVRVGTFLEVRNQDFVDIRPLGFLYKLPAEGNLEQVFLGGYTDKAAAETMAERLRQMGFANAQVVTRPLAEGREVVVIQIATRYADRSIDWEALQRAGDLYVLLENETIKVVTGMFNSVEDANAALPDIRALGYPDAFIKRVNAAAPAPVTGFSTGLKEPLIPLNFSDTQPAVQPQPSPQPTPRDLPMAMDQPTERMTVRAPVTRESAAPPAQALPDIRMRVKRRSALELQKILQAEGYYTSTLDGYYGPGTTSAYEAMLSQDLTLRKYRLLAANLPVGQPAASGNALQQAINQLRSNPEAARQLERSDAPAALAYQGYLLFISLGPSNDVNDLMNRAIRQAYNGASREAVGFNYQATYAYQDLDQLILHLHYLHAAERVNHELPCWLSQYHPDESARARATIGHALPVESCDPLPQWPEIALLQAIAFDLTPSARQATDRLRADAGRRSALYLATEPLDEGARRQVESWYQRLWVNLNNWGIADPLHADMIKALKVAFYQSEVRLEDHFMDQGFDAEPAKALALATLQTIVGTPLDRFE